MTQTADQREEHKEELVELIGGLPTGAHAPYKAALIGHQPERGPELHQFSSAAQLDPQLAA